jgi:two-component system nitrate/nitrite response regulator NarL
MKASGTSGNIRVLVAIGVRLYCQGLAQLLNQTGKVESVGIAEDFSSLIVQARSIVPAVILLDSALFDGIDCIALVLNACPSSRILALGVNETEDEIIAYAEAGISGYVVPEASIDDLVLNIAHVAEGKLLCPPKIAAALLRYVNRAGRRIPELDKLSSREFETLKLIAQGLSNKEIAARLNIEVSTVKNHVHHVLDKLGVEGRGQAAAEVITESV